MRDGGLRLALDLPQVSLAAKTLRIDLVDIFGARRPRAKPSAVGDDLDPAERLTVSGCGGEHPSNQPARQIPHGQLFPRKRPHQALLATGVRAVPPVLNRDTPR